MTSAKRRACASSRSCSARGPGSASTIPQAGDNFRQQFPEEPGRVAYAASAYQAVEKANAVLILTEWEEFMKLDLARLKQAMANPIIVDGRNIFEPDGGKGPRVRVLFHRPEVDPGCPAHPFP